MSAQISRYGVRRNDSTMKDVWKPILALLLCLVGIGSLFSDRAIKRAPGVLVASSPLQQPTQAAAFQFGAFELRPRAEYDIEARVLSVERYSIGADAKLSPIDFAVGWGAMSDSAVLEHFRITQGARFFTIYPDPQAVDLATALHGSANMHLIPADSHVDAQVHDVRPGHIVRLHGYLVDARGANGYYWNTSLTRDDTGAGACELFYVQSVTRR